MKLRKINILLALGILALAGPHLHAQQTATGTVFLDANGNGKMDENETGIADVPVSNGKVVVLTDQDGDYSIKIEEEGQLFVIKPSGYRIPTDSLNRAQFYYLHKPDGSPELKYNGVNPTGPLPDSINFPLQKGKQKNSYSVLLFGDPQPASRKQVSYFDEDIVSELVETDEYRFGITLGDLVWDKLELFTPYSKSAARIGLPWYNVYGNHDMNFDAEKDKYADETYEAHFGPATYAFNYGKAHFIVLDNVIYPRPEGKSGYIGGFTDQQLAFIENDLKHVPKDRLVVLAFHIPIKIPEGRNTFRRKDRKKLFDLLEEYPHTLSLSSHKHKQSIFYFGEDRHWSRPNPHMHYNVGTTSGDWWSGEPDERGIPQTLMRDGTPNGYGILNIEGNEFSIDYKAANYSADYRMSIWAPEAVVHNTWPRPHIYVNYFLGSKRTTVQYRVKDETDWRNMNRTKSEDPYVASLRTKWDTANNHLEGKRPSNPVPSNHVWKTAVPDHVSPGDYKIIIRVKNQFDRTFTDTLNLKIKDS